MQEAAFNRLKAEHKITGTFEEWKNRSMVGQLWDDAFAGKTMPGEVESQGWHEQVNIEAQRMLAEAAQRAGVAFEIPKVGRYRTSAYMGDEALYAKQQEIQRADGDPLSDTAKDIKRAADAMERTAAAIERNGAGRPEMPNGKAPAPALVRPPGEAPRPGG